MEPMHDFINRGIWTMVEANTEITYTCIPMLKYSIQRLIPQFRWNSKGTTGTNGRFQGNSHGLQYFSAKTRRVDTDAVYKATVRYFYLTTKPRRRIG
ncbi:uncharacterized protein BDW43DRAFT_269371 [Aspergillus alliaceus]|uniref:uncharacterized protein n=1 Tax=Petromyces alliaceus TaxID=209559 RepID=UPI0012A615E8|nr:uncharacterized protein BDW43DRAFT_269371 [Aspergillus alliaceus]KAB8235659.1 hypothetical protein BDW43DRAFT_269371 [Aspergillus alliaceus]